MGNELDKEPMDFVSVLLTRVNCNKGERKKSSFFIATGGKHTTFET